MRVKLLIGNGTLGEMLMWSEENEGAAVGDALIPVVGTQFYYALDDNITS